jgi:ankyrin repeat protein
MTILRWLFILCSLMPGAAGAQQLPPSPQEQALHEAAYSGDLEAADGLLGEGAAVDVRDPDGRTPLMLASFNGHAAVAAYLLDKGAAVNAREVSGRTALMYACSGPFVETVQLLLERGADVNIQGTVEGFTALMTAAAEGQLQIVRVLLAHGADPDLKDVDGDTAESFAKQKGHPQVIAALRNPPPPVKKP